MPLGDSWLKVRDEVSYIVKKGPMVDSVPTFSYTAIWDVLSDVKRRLTP